MRKPTAAEKAAWVSMNHNGDRVWSEWKESFTAFFLDAGPRPAPGYVFRRLDPDGPWTPRNTSWLHKTSKTKFDRHRILTYKGQSKPLSAWANAVGLPRATLWNRIVRHGWTVERALETPVRAFENREGSG